MPGHEPSGFEQVVGQVTFCVGVAVGVWAPVMVGLGVGVGPLIGGGVGIVTVKGSPAGEGVGVGAIGVTEGTGTEASNLCT